MLKRIYIVLTGEDEKKRPRSKRAIEIIRATRLADDEYKIILSGLSHFNPHAYSSESSRMKRFFVRENIPEKNIILEENSIDTLGNMVFSYEIVESLLIGATDQDVDVVLITEDFHMRRSRRLLEYVFRDLKTRYPLLRFLFEEARSSERIGYSTKRELTKARKSLKEGTKLDENAKAFLGRIFSKKRHIVDFFIMDIIVTDIRFFGLKSYGDFRNYLFCLPFYKQKHKAKRNYLVGLGVYSHVIDHIMYSKREQIISDQKMNLIEERLESNSL